MINISPKLSKEQLDCILNSTLFTLWKNSFFESGCNITKININGAVFLNDQSIHSIFLEVYFSTPEGHSLTRSILLKGKSVVVIPLVYFNLELIPKVLMVKQRRICSGEFTIEFPSGKSEEGFASSLNAQLELFEECGVKVALEDIKPLAQSIIVCESAFDESVDWFYCKISFAELPMMNPSLTLGNNLAGEFTYPTLATIDELKKINSFQIKTGLELLFENNVLDPYDINLQV